MSGGNCKSAYIKAHLSQDQLCDAEEGGWRFGMKLRTEHVWDAFVIWTLLQQHDKCHEIVVVPHRGDQKDRFTALMIQRNDNIIIHGQEEISHYCDKCMRVWVDESGVLRNTCFLLHPKNN